MPSKPLESKWKTGLVYGRSGTGKTTFASTCKNALLVDINERGTDSILGKPIDVEYIKSWRDIGKLIDRLSTRCTYNTVIFDTMTSLQGLRVRETTGGKYSVNFGELTLRQWGSIAQDLKTFIYEVHDRLNCNVLYTAHQRTFGIDEDGEEGIDPEKNAAMMPSVVATLNGYCEFIVNSFITESTEKRRVSQGGKMVMKTVRSYNYCLRTGPNPVYTTKLRSVIRPMPEFLINPTWDDVINLMKGTTQKCQGRDQPLPQTQPRQQLRQQKAGADQKQGSSRSTLQGSGFPARSQPGVTRSKSTR